MFEFVGTRPDYFKIAKINKFSVVSIERFIFLIDKRLISAIFLRFFEEKFG